MADCHSNPTHRGCTKCGERKELDLFGNATKGRYGKKSVCKSCERAYIEHNKEKMTPYWKERSMRVRAEQKAKRPGFVGPVFDGHLKRCCRCSVAKPLACFQRCTDAKDGLQKRCATCATEVASEYRERHKEKINAYRKSWRIDNPERAKKERDSSYRSKVDRLGESLYLRSRISCGLRRSLASGKQSRSAFSLLEFTLGELKTHLEKQFLYGMSWANMHDWHIDHITPLASFGPLEVGTSDFKAAWHITNLRPIWAQENIDKNAKIQFLI